MTQDKVRVWDLPVRLFHWSLVLLIPAMWWTAENHDLETHVQLGMIALILVVFRLLWGIVGSETARFSSFVRGPAAIRAYIGGPGGRTFGHNPLGALSVIALLGAVGVQIALGLFAQDTDGLDSGPLSHLVSYDISHALSEAHEVMFNVIVALVVIHFGAILFYRFVRRTNLVSPMVTGHAEAIPGIAPPRIAPLWLALLCFAVAVAIGWGIFYGALA